MRIGTGPGSRGFTIIEVAVVLVILSLAAAVVLPGIGRAADTLRARSETAGVSAFLRHAREQAITRGETHEVRLDRDAQILVLTTGDGKVVKASRQVRRPARVEIDPPATRAVTFLPEGRSSGGAFLIETPGRQLYRVAVDPLSGRVTNQRLDS
jgi:general secretion pathway protein H